MEKWKEGGSESPSIRVILIRVNRKKKKKKKKKKAGKAVGEKPQAEIRGHSAKDFAEFSVWGLRAQTSKVNWGLLYMKEPQNPSKRAIRKCRCLCPQISACGMIGHLSCLEKDKIQKKKKKEDERREGSERET